MFIVLIADYFSQMVAILLIQLSNFVIDYGRPTSTDRINESKYIFKPVTFIMNSFVSNIFISFIIMS